jgi:hypothetical protein
MTFGAALLWLVLDFAGFAACFAGFAASADPGIASAKTQIASVFLPI